MMDSIKRNIIIRIRSLLSIVLISFLSLESVQAQTYVPYDSDFDGCVSTSDMLDMLSSFGECYMGNNGCAYDMLFQGDYYSTVQIGSQCWFAENLRYLPSIYPSSEMSFHNPRFYVYGYEGYDVNVAKTTSAFDLHGVLYNHKAITNYSLCPSGWRVPQSGDFITLIDHLGGDLVAGSDLKATDYWSYSGAGSNSSGFNMRASGALKSPEEGFIKIGTGAYLASSFIDNPGGLPENQLFLGLSPSNATALDIIPNLTAMSVRCVRIPIEGCMDSNSCTFDSYATFHNEDLCEYPAYGFDCNGCDTTEQVGCTCFNIEISSDIYDTSEMKWSIEYFESIPFSVQIAEGYGGSQDLCLSDWCYRIVMSSIWETWYSVEYVITNIVTGEILVTGTLDDAAYVDENGVGEDYFYVNNNACDIGCTDELACNYDPIAYFDDGSCAVDDECGVCGGDNSSCTGCIDPTACDYDPSATIQAVQAGSGSGSLSFTWLSVGLLASEISWDVDGTTYAAGDEPALTLPIGTYTINGYDSNANGWNGGALQITDDLSGSSVTLMVSGASGSVSIDVTDSGGGALICDYTSCAGCTDDTACNYDDTATLEDGSCDYLSCAGCTDPTGCNYDATATFDDGTCEILDACGICGGDSSCDGCTEATACNYDPAAIVDDGSCASDDICGVCGGDDSSCTGCTDAAACNYDAGNTIDDGSCVFGNGVNITVGGGAYDYEISWSVILNGASVVTGGAGSQDLCIGDGCYTLSMGDSYGDGWNGAIYTLTDVATGTVIMTGSLDTAANGDGTTAGNDYFAINSTDCSFGCIDATACNYAATATQDDGTCYYMCVGCMDSTAWNYDPLATIACVDCCTYCSSAAFAGTLTVGGGSYPYEIGWTLTLNTSLGIVQIASGGAGSFDLCLGTGCYIFDMTDSFGDGWNGGTYSFDEDNGVNAFTGDLDTADAGDGIYIGTDYLNLNSGTCIIGGCTDAVACNYVAPATFDDGSCEYLTCSGCTDSTYCNYEPLATIDDGTCCVFNCVEIVMFDNFSNGWNGGYYVLTHDTGAGIIVMGNGTIDSGISMLTDSYCLSSACYTIEVVAGFAPSGGLIVDMGSSGQISVLPGETFTFFVGNGVCP